MSERKQENGGSLRIVTTILTLVLTAVLLLAASCSEASTDTQTSDTRGETDTAPTGDWVEVASFEGMRNENTESFALEGAEQRIEYEATGGDDDGEVEFTVKGADDATLAYEMFDLAIVPPATTVQDDSRMYIRAGICFVKVNAVNVASWRVTIYEKR